MEYVFFLKDAIDNVPEWLVHKKALDKIALKYELEKVSDETFQEFEDNHSLAKEELVKTLTKKGISLSKDDLEVCYLYQTFVYKKKGYVDFYDG